MSVPSRRVPLVIVAALVAPCACGPGPAAPPAEVAVIPIAAPPRAAPGALVAAEEEAPARPAIRGMGKIRVGQPVAEVRRILGPESRSVSAESEAREWTSAGYEPNAGLVFLIGFDSMLVYDTPPPGETLPFWKIYVKQGRVVFIILSSFSDYGNDVVLSRVGFPPSCFMMADEAEVERTFGKSASRVEDTPHGHTTYHYLDRGVSVIAVEGQIRVFDIYGPIEGRRRATFHKALTTPMSAVRQRP